MQGLFIASYSLIEGLNTPAAIDTLPAVGMTWLLSGPSVGKPTLHRAGCADHGRHGGGAPAMCGRPLMSALNFRFLFFKKKEEKSLFLYLCPIKQCMMLLKPLFDRTIALIGLLLEMIAEYVAQRQKEGDPRSAQEIAVEYNDTVIYPDKVRLNCYYYRHYSFVKDIQMLFCTVLGRGMEYAGEVI